MKNEQTMDGAYIIEQAVNAMRGQWREEELAMTYDLTPQDNPMVKGVLKIFGTDFMCFVENEVTKFNVGRIREKIDNCTDLRKLPLLLVARYVQPATYEFLRSSGINFTDTAGNYQIRQMKGKRPLFQISHTGEKEPAPVCKTYPIFYEAGLKIIFYLLQDKDNVNKTFREIKDQCDVSLGTVKNVFDELEARKFILIGGKKRILYNKRRLLDLWVENYNHILKPKLALKRLAFKDTQALSDWTKMTLPDGFYWGGECAAYLHNGFMTPVKFDIYTDVKSAHLLRTGMVLTRDGEITIYHKFWKGSHMPMILIYADLLGSGNSRCIEAANKLLNDELTDFK